RGSGHGDFIERLIIDAQLHLRRLGTGTLSGRLDAERIFAGGGDIEIDRGFIARAEEGDDAAFTGLGAAARRDVVAREPRQRDADRAVDHDLFDIHDARLLASDPTSGYDLVFLHPALAANAGAHDKPPGGNAHPRLVPLRLACVRGHLDLAHDGSV